MKPLTDIVIPIHNRPEHTKQTLESLFDNTNPLLYRLYIINDNSNEETVELLKKYTHEVGQRKGVAVWLGHTEENVGPAVSRNSVCKMITDKNQRSKYLYHSDNDVYFYPGWINFLTEIYEQFYKEGFRLIGAGCHPYLQTNTTYQSDFGFRLGTKDAVSGYSQLMDWKTWDKYGPFDEGSRGLEMKISGSEDWAFSQKIVKDGYLVGSIEPELVIHTGKTNTYDKPATGAETFKDIEGINIK